MAISCNSNCPFKKAFKIRLYEASIFRSVSIWFLSGIFDPSESPDKTDSYEGGIERYYKCYAFISDNNYSPEKYI